MSVNQTTPYNLNRAEWAGHAIIDVSVVTIRG
jgi:hypothetical protein